jgi:lipopolysaccharide/colanic/teichoic acid biosynthesis glycosyltransferase
VPAELEHYPNVEQLLLSVRPGLTGQWAANGRHHVGYPQRAALELRYVRSWTLWGDAVIILKTVRAVFDYESTPSQP